MTTEAPKSVLDEISTCWSSISNPVQFVLRYSRAIQKYVQAIVKNPQDAEDVTQEFLTKVFEKSFCPQNVSAGRFRNYLRGAVRFVALNHWRQRRPEQLSDEVAHSLLQPEESSETVWITEWRTCLLDRVWQELELHENQKQADGNLYYSALRQYTENPQASSEDQAAALSVKLGRPLRADAYRQQVSRARKKFAQMVVQEVRRTLQHPTDETLQQELMDLELWDYVKDLA